MTVGARLDAWLYRKADQASSKAPGPDGTSWLDTDVGRLRIFDSGGHLPPVVFAPDGPCVIEHFATLIAALRTRRRVICFDLPGFGYSFPGPRHSHRISDGAAAILSVISALDLKGVTLALSCVNGFYAMRAAALAPDRIQQLVLSQTPSLAAMSAWTDRIVPKPIRVPIAGQLINFATRRRVADGWYRVAVADKIQRSGFQQTADHALAHGACYCFAGVVQGMSAEAPDTALAPLDIPATVVWGSRDRSHSQTDPESIRIHLASAQIVRFDQCGHFPELEDTARYVDLVASLSRT